MVELLSHQKDFVNASEHEVIMLAPPGTGKTFAQIFDTQEYATKNPDSMQVLGFSNHYIMFQCGYFESFYKCGAKLDRTRNEFIFSNGARVMILNRSDMESYQRTRGLIVNVFRIDTIVFDVSHGFYMKCILQIDRPEQLRPKQIKITAEDCMYSFAKRKELHKIEVE